MTRSLVLPLVALFGTGCGISDPGMLAGAAGSAAGGQGGRAGSPGGRGGAAATGLTGGGGAGGAPRQCGGRDYVIERLPPHILILLDASDSMNESASGTTCAQGCGAASKWAETVAAIKATVSRTDIAVSWGLKFFPDTDGACSVAPLGVAVPPGPGNAAAIATALDGRTSANGGISNGGSTPTRAAENAAVSYFSTQTNPNPKFILLATDGLPNCVAGQTDTATDDSAGAVQSVENARAAGYPTFVVGVGIGIGNPTADATLNQMATAGGYPRAASPAYYPVASTAELESVLNTAVSTSWSCTFAIPTPPTNDGTTTRSHIGVRIDGTTIPRDNTHTNGWDYSDGSMMSIQLFGTSCDAVSAGEVHKVTVYFNCIAV